MKIRLREDVLDLALVNDRTSIFLKERKEAMFPSYHQQRRKVTYI